MKFTVRNLVYIAIFGALWGILEMTIGAYLHVILPSLADTFLVGIVMGSLGIIVALVGRRFVPKPGAVFMIAIIAMLLKAVSLGGVKLGPMLAIAIEGALMELGLLAWSGESPASYTLAGALAVSWNFFHKFLMMRLLYGKEIVEVGIKMVKDGNNLLGIDSSSAILILGILFSARVIVGMAAGWVAWGLGSAVQRRRRRQATVKE